jgi:adenylate cyclase
MELVNGLVAAGYILLAIVTGALAGRRQLSELADWLRSERPPDARIRREVVRAPLRLFNMQLALWLAAALLFGVLNLIFSPALSAIVAPTIAITGITTGACAYLLAERILRTPASLALADEDPGRVAVPGVATRAVLAWAFGTAAPVLGLVIVGIAGLAGAPASATQLKVVIVVLGAIALVVGLLAVSLAARATADPIDNVRGALERIQRGDFDARVSVYDGTQIGRLQLGFNRMAEGLAERERIRDTFGSYVDPAVAERILDDGVELSGEEVEVTIMFIDIRGFTTFAEATDAREVVAGVNTLFDLVNVAARVQEATRETGDTVLLTDHTRGLLAEEPVVLVERSRVELRGRSEPVVVYAPRPSEDSPTG